MLKKKTKKAGGHLKSVSSFWNLPISIPRLRFWCEWKGKRRPAFRDFLKEQRRAPEGFPPKEEKEEKNENQAKIQAEQASNTSMDDTQFFFRSSLSGFWVCGSTSTGGFGYNVITYNYLHMTCMAYTHHLLLSRLFCMVHISYIVAWYRIFMGRVCVWVGDNIFWFGLK